MPSDGRNFIAAMFDQKGKVNDLLRDVLDTDVDRDLKKIRDRASAKIEESQFQNEYRYNLRRKATLMNIK